MMTGLACLGVLASYFFLLVFRILQRFSFLLRLLLSTGSRLMDAHKVYICCIAWLLA